MNNIIKPKISKLPELPQIDESTITFKKSTIIIIVILVCIMIMFSTYSITSKDSNIKDNLMVYCNGPKSLVEKNNIQASHAYIEKISNRDTLTCIKADDVGLLFGNSMQPTFFEGNTIMLKNYTEEIELHTGDLIRYFRFNNEHSNCSMLKKQIANNSLGGSWINNSMAVIHRISAIYDNDILTQGDNLNEQEHIEKCQITDIAVGIIFT
jgi:hypothetical protein